MRIALLDSWDATDSSEVWPSIPALGVESGPVTSFSVSTRRVFDAWAGHFLLETLLIGLQLLDPRTQLSSQCWLPQANKICGLESSLCWATVPGTCQMAPASAAKLVKSFWNWQIFFQPKLRRAKPNTCWQNKVQTGICFGDQSNAIYLFFFGKENKKWAVNVLKTTTKLSSSCEWRNVLGWCQRLPLGWIVLESSSWLQGPCWGTLQTDFTGVLRCHSQPGFSASWFSLNLMPPLDLQMSFLSLLAEKGSASKSSASLWFIGAREINHMYDILVGAAVTRN